LIQLYNIGNEPADLEKIGLKADSNEAQNLINYKQMSVNLGIHKDSYNYLNQV
jgi:hypothetical protein